MKVDKPVGVLFVGFLQAFNGAVDFSEPDVDSGEEVWCDILLLGQRCQIIEDLNCFLCSARRAESVRQRCEHQRTAA